MRWPAGCSVTYLEVINAQRTLLEAELNLACTRRDQLFQGILLYQALGGRQAQ